ncbi:UbiA family prenyltransferase [Candidatus Pseudothioglobus singularis]|jgi:4-hydroxybenzoate polyprenyltransferase|nr:UbiA family prenyltransferase [Candidatus Pseudothioglobus singularis]MDA8855443.1 UbiA family prenyltransferase [Candidatus Pseudothioglobus singularis]
MSLKDWLLALRLHQWAKNILVFVPIILIYRFKNTEDILIVFLAFLVFGLVASANYLINDMMDLDSDRRHPTKKNRPLASGKLSLRNAVIAVLMLLLGAISFIFILPLIFFGALAIYLTISILYSLILKQIVILDVIVLAGLYTMRIISGALVIKTIPTFWLLAFSMFFFFSLALIKRYTELRLIKTSSKEDEYKSSMHGRKYLVEDMVILQIMGLGSGLLAVLVFALYINSVEIKLLYNLPEILWLALPVLLFWITRMWLLANRGLMHEDPVVFAITDRASLVSAFSMLIFLWLAASLA